MAGLTALQRLMASPKTARFVETLRHADLPTGWADDPEIVGMAAEPGLAYGTDKALGAMLGLFQRNKRTGGGGGI